MTEKAKRRQVKEMETARQVRMGEDRDAVQEEYKSKLLTDSDDGDRSEEEESESWDADSFVVKPHGTVGLQIPEGFGTSVSAPEARKRVAEYDVTPMQEVKQA
jgi:hypothetical protein